MYATPRTTPVLTVVRYLLLDRLTYFVFPWTWAAIAFGIDVVILELTPAGHGHNRWVGGLGAVFVVVFVLGVQAVARALPFGLALGVSRRTYFLGATALATILGACFGGVVAVGQAVERATDGWGIRMAYFRVPDLLDGSWWQTWLTAWTAFVLLFAYGMWYGLIYRSGGLVGSAVFAGAQAGVLALLAAITTWTHSWAHLGHFFATTATACLPAMLAGLAIILLSGAMATARRLAV